MDQRPESSRKDAELDALLRESIRHSGLEGQPLHLTTAPFSRSAAGSILGLMGQPAWSVRLKRIHDGRTALTAQTEAAWAEYAHRYRDRPELFARRWTEYVHTLDLAPLNTLIQKHNDYYVIEARIPMQWPTGAYLLPDGIEWPQKPVTPEALLHEYPPDLDMAAYFANAGKDVHHGGTEAQRGHGGF